MTKDNKIWSYVGSATCDSCRKKSEKKTFLLEFMADDLRITLGEIVHEMCQEENKEKRKKLLKDYDYNDRLLSKYLDAIERNEEILTWDKLLKERRYSLADLVLFKKIIIDEVGIKRWNKAVKSNYKSMGKEKVEEYLKNFEKTGNIYC